MRLISLDYHYVDKHITKATSLNETTIGQFADNEIPNNEKHSTLINSPKTKTFSFLIRNYDG